MIKAIFKSLYYIIKGILIVALACSIIYLNSENQKRKCEIKNIEKLVEISDTDLARYIGKTKKDVNILKEFHKELFKYEETQ